MRKQITGNEEIKLYSWMAQEGLKGNALVVYAIVLLYMMLESTLGATGI